MKNKEKYSLDKLRISVTHTVTGISDIEIFHGIKRVYYKSYSVEEFTLRWITDFMKWLEEECVSKILTDKEKAYLSAVIKPFRKRIEYIEKRCFVSGTEYILISLQNNKTLSFPTFKTGTMYKGMKSRKEYTLEELGL